MYRDVQDVRIESIQHLQNTHFELLYLMDGQSGLEVRFFMVRDKKSNNAKMMFQISFQNKPFSSKFDAIHVWKNANGIPPIVVR